MEERPVALLAAVLRGRPATGELVGRPEPFSIQLDAASTILRLVDGGSAVPHAGRLLWDWLVGPTPRKAAPFASQVGRATARVHPSLATQRIDNSVHCLGLLGVRAAVASLDLHKAEARCRRRRKVAAHHVIHISG